LKLARFCAITFTASLALLPILLLIVYSFAQSWFWPDLRPRHWSARAWSYVLADDSGVFAAAGVSLAIAAAVAALALVVSIPAARAIAWHEFPGKRWLLFLLLLPVLAPPLAAAMGVHGLFLRYGLTETMAGVILVHLLPAVPYAILMLAGSFSRLDPDLEAQARTLGASPIAVLRYVTLPAIAPGMAVAAAFAFLISWSQYQLTILIGGGRVLTLPLTLVAFQRGGDEAITAALSLLFLFPALAVFAAVSRCLRYET
jgi:ABC-type spermidine/putrescine transport system, permease component II